MYANEIKLGNGLAASEASIERIEKKVVRKKRRKSVDRTIFSVFLYAAIAMGLKEGLTWAYSVVSGHPEYKNGDFGIILMLAFAAPVIFFLYRGVKNEGLDLKKVFNGECKMSFGRFMLMILFVLGISIASQLFISIGESVAQGFGFSLMEDSEWAKGGSITTVSLVIYGCLIGPIAEELLFRGYVLNSFKKHGELFAIISSALLFGAFHGNVIQLIHAGLTGLIYGFVASRYGVKWSIGLHFFNNAVWGQGIKALLFLTGSELIGLSQMLLPTIAFFGSIIYLFLNRKKFMGFIRRNKTNASLAYVLTSVWFIAVVLLRFI